MAMQASQLTLTSAWQPIGSGPLLVQVLSGSVSVLVSDSLPSASDTTSNTVTAAIGEAVTQFNGTGRYFAKAIATGSAVPVTPLPASPTGLSGRVSPASQQVSSIILLEKIASVLAALPRMRPSPAFLRRSELRPRTAPTLRVSLCRPAAKAFAGGCRRATVSWPRLARRLPLVHTDMVHWIA